MASVGDYLNSLRANPGAVLSAASHALTSPTGLGLVGGALAFVGSRPRDPLEEVQKAAGPVYERADGQIDAAGRAARLGFNAGLADVVAGSNRTAQTMGVQIRRAGLARTGVGRAAVAGVRNAGVVTGGRLRSSFEGDLAGRIAESRRALAESMAQLYGQAALARAQQPTFGERLGNALGAGVDIWGLFGGGDN